MDLNDTTNRVIAVIVLLLVFIGGWWLIARNAVGSKAVSTNVPASSSEETDGEVMVKPEAPKAPSKPSAPAPVVTATNEELSVLDQPAGSSVQVRSATLAQNGWVAVRDSAGRVLGAARVDAGTHSNVAVDLLRATTAGEQYQVLVYVDNGDKEFDLRADTLVMKSDGSVAGASFTAQ